jgi:hypothetical protein
MKRILTIRLALLIVCALSINTAFAQDANTKEVVKKQTKKKVVPCKWHKANNFSEGLAKVENAKDKWGFINKSGKVVIPYKWESAGDFNEGLACVQDANGKYVYIDKTGQVVM